MWARNSLQKRPARSLRPTCHFGRQCGDRASAGDILTVSGVQIRVDQCLHLAAGRCLLDRGDRAVAPLFQGCFECLDDQTLFAAEVPIEAAVGQAEVAHQLGDRRPIGSAAAKPAGRGADDAVACLLLVIGGVTHNGDVR